MGRGRVIFNLTNSEVIVIVPMRDDGSLRQECNGQKGKLQ